jgi:hypothetical protein
MRAFFLLSLCISILFPPVTFVASMRDFAHNQWEMRQRRLDGKTRVSGTSAHLGLTVAQVAGLDELARAAYKDAVYDGYRLGAGYELLWFGSLGLDALLFIVSLIGLLACRASSRLTIGSSQPLTGS